mmetsp:Transcript_21152/g.53759  ORF Transcript_21152/g.53759 Transcript_21152/m.53759 type:complete len:225 (+) Transcript_21152:444-1118(+)
MCLRGAPLASLVAVVVAAESGKRAAAAAVAGVAAAVAVVQPPRQGRVPRRVTRLPLVPRAAAPLPVAAVAVVAATQPPSRQKAALRVPQLALRAAVVGAGAVAAAEAAEAAALTQQQLLLRLPRVLLPRTATPSWSLGPRRAAQAQPPVAPRCLARRQLAGVGAVAAAARAAVDGVAGAVAVATQRLPGMQQRMCQAPRRVLLVLPPPHGPHLRPQPTPRASTQ